MTHPPAPHIDWAAISPLVALTVGACLVLMAGLLRPAFVRRTLVPAMTIVTLGVAIGLGVWQWDENQLVVSGALAIDNLTLALLMIFATGAIAATLLIVNPVSLDALRLGHPEERLCSSLCVMALLFARDRQIVAGILLGSALATKQWALIAIAHPDFRESLERAARENGLLPKGFA